MSLFSKEINHKENKTVNNWGQGVKAVEEPVIEENNKETHIKENQDLNFNKANPSQPDILVRPSPNNFNIQLQPDIVTPKMNPASRDADFRIKGKEELQGEKEKKQEPETEHSKSKEFSVSGNDGNEKTTEDKKTDKTGKPANGTEIENKEKSEQKQIEQKRKGETIKPEAPPVKETTDKPVLKPVEPTVTGKIDEKTEQKPAGKTYETGVKPGSETTDKAVLKPGEQITTGKTDEKSKTDKAGKENIEDKAGPEKAEEPSQEKPVEGSEEELEEVPEDVILSLLDFVNIEEDEETPEEQEDSEEDTDDQSDIDSESDVIQASFEENPGNNTAVETPETGEDAVGELTDSISIKAETSVLSIKKAANKIKNSAWTKNKKIKEDIANKISTDIKDVSKAFEDKRIEIGKLISDTRKNIEKNFNKTHEQVDDKGKKSKEKIDTLFTDFKTNVGKKVTEYIGKSNDLNTESKNKYRKEQQEQAAEARNKGERKAAIYSDTERGLKQQKAVRATAEETAKAIEEKIEDNVNALGEVTQEIPDTFKEQGDKALEGIDEKKQPLYETVDKQVEAMHKEVNAKMDEMVLALNNFEKKVNEDLSKEKESVTTKIKNQLEPANKNADKIAANIAQKINDSSERVINSIHQTVKDSALIINKKRKSKKDNLVKFSNSVCEFFTKTESDTIASFTDGMNEQSKGLYSVKEALFKSVDEQTTQADKSLPGVLNKATEFLSKLQEQSEGVFKNILTECDRISQEFHDEIKKKFDDNIVLLDIGFKKVLDDAKAKIYEAKLEGLAKGDEALIELNSKMTEAASEAAWQHDHPVLSFIWDALSFIAGLIVGILMIIVIVVVVIVAFKVLVAGLVALGVSALVAEIIVGVIGLVMLGAMVYSAYTARREQGQSGWSAFFGALGDVSGVSDIIHGFTAPGLSPFERGFFIGKGAATVASFFLGGRLNRGINKGLARLAESTRFPRIARFSKFIQKPKITNLGRRLRNRYPKLYEANKRILAFGKRMKQLNKQVGEKVNEYGRSIKRFGKGLKKSIKQKTTDFIKKVKSKFIKKKWDPILNKDLAPNSTYTVNKYTFETDALGRIKNVKGELELKPGGRNTYQQKKSVTIKDGVSGDQGGHLIGDRFNGPGEQINYLPMKESLNNGAWKAMENTWAKALSKGQTVEVDINPIFSGTSKRPVGFDVNYKIDNNPFTRTFKN